MKNIRLLDVAEKAGVSSAAVTRFIHGSGYISNEKRGKIEEAMRELGYVMPAKTGKPASSEEIPCVLVFHYASGQYGNTLFFQIGEELGLALQNKGWLMISYYLTEESGSESIQSVILKLQNRNLKGIVFNSSGRIPALASMHSFLVSQSVPVVMVERTPDMYGVNKVMLNSKEMLYMSVRHLVRLGHRKIAFISVQNDSQEVERSRCQGFAESVRSMGLADDAFFVNLSCYTFEEGYNAMEKLRRENRLPTAVIAADPVMAGISNWLYEHELRVPKDISLIGLDNTIAYCSTPRITSIAFPITEIAQNTVRILEEGQTGDVLPQNVLLSMKMIDRGSTAGVR